MRTITQRMRRGPVLLSLLLIIALAAAGCTFEVQPIEDYTSEDGYLTVTIPLSWDVLEDNADDGITAVFVGTNPDVIDMEVVSPGDAGVGIAFGPDFLFEAEFGFKMDASDLAEFFRSGLTAEEPTAEASEVEKVTLPSGIEAYMFTLAMPDVHLSVHTFAPTDETLGLALTVTSPGEEDAALLDEVESVLNSFRFTGDPEAFAERGREAMNGG